VLKLARDYHERLISVARDRGGVQSGNKTKPEIQDVKKQEEEQKNAGDPLENVEPVAGISVVKDIGL